VCVGKFRPGGSRKKYGLEASVCELLIKILTIAHIHTHQVAPLGVVGFAVGGVNQTPGSGTRAIRLARALPAERARERVDLGCSIKTKDAFTLDFS
jgi:hypothetical protein